MSDKLKGRIGLRDGIIPTMLAAYRDDGNIDYNAMSELIEFYIRNGIDGLFALCHSTESHWLTLDEKVNLAKFTIREVNGRVPVVMSGITASTIEKQLYEAQIIADCGADAVVFIRNRLGSDEYIFKKNIDCIIKLDNDIPLGLYECPYYYKQYITDAEFRYVFSTGRFKFIKDTICNVPAMKKREITRSECDPLFKLYNANCATFLKTLRFGYNGFCGIMANFHPDLYSWLFKHPNDKRADIIDKYLGVMSLIEMRSYPICAKRYLKKYERINITEVCRSVGDTTVQALDSELDGIHVLTDIARDLIKDNN